MISEPIHDLSPSAKLFHYCCILKKKYKSHMQTAVKTGDERKWSLFRYQYKQPGPLANSRQVGEGRHLVALQTATEPAQHAGRLGLQVGQTLHLRKDG